MRPLRRRPPFAAHALIEGVAHILVAAAARILHELGHTHVELIAEREPCKQGLRALAERTGEGSQALGIGLERLQLLVPGLIACKHVAQIPSELFSGTFAARKDRLTVHRFTVLFSKFRPPSAGRCGLASHYSGRKQ